MKRTFIALAFVLLATPAFAQDQTLFNGTLESGGFGGPVVKLTPVKNELGILTGGYGGWLINHTFMIGGGGFGLVNDIRADAAVEQRLSLYGDPLYLNLGYGGLMLEVIMRPSDLVHFYVNTLIGGGAVTYRNGWMDHNDMFDNSSNNNIGGSDAFFVLEPSINAELNLTTWMRLGAGVSYRWISQAGMLDGISNASLSGAAGQLTLKFGAF